MKKHETGDCRTEPENFEDCRADWPGADFCVEKKHDPNICIAESSDEDICRLLRKYDRLAIVRDFFRNPARHFRENPGILAAAGIISGIILSLLFIFSMSLRAGPAVAFIITPAFSVSIIPYIAFSHMKCRCIEHAEERVPDILREIADRVKGGKIPDISKEPLFRNGFLSESNKSGNFSSRSANESEIIRKAAFIAKTSEKAGGRIQDALIVAAADAKEKIADRKEKKSKMQPYAYVMIASYLIFLGIITFLVFSVFGSIGNDFGTGAMTVNPESGINSMMNINSINGIANMSSAIAKTDSGLSERIAGLSKSAICIFNALVIQGFFCGLICGKIISGRISEGLPYSVFCVMCSWTLWIFLI